MSSLCGAQGGYYLLFVMLTFCLLDLEHTGRKRNLAPFVSLLNER